MQSAMENIEKTLSYLQQMKDKELISNEKIQEIEKSINIILQSKRQALHEKAPSFLNECLESWQGREEIITSDNNQDDTLIERYCAELDYIPLIITNLKELITNVSSIAFHGDDKDKIRELTWKHLNPEKYHEKMDKKKLAQEKAQSVSSKKSTNKRRRYSRDKPVPTHILELGFSLNAIRDSFVKYDINSYLGLIENQLIKGDEYNCYAIYASLQVLEKCIQQLSPNDPNQTRCQKYINHLLKSATTLLTVDRTVHSHLQMIHMILSKGLKICKNPEAEEINKILELFIHHLDQAITTNDYYENQHLGQNIGMCSNSLRKIINEINPHLINQILEKFKIIIENKSISPDFSVTYLPLSMNALKNMRDGIDQKQAEFFLKEYHEWIKTKPLNAKSVVDISLFLNGMGNAHLPINKKEISELFNLVADYYHEGHQSDSPGQDLALTIFGAGNACNRLNANKITILLEKLVDYYQDHTLNAYTLQDISMTLKGAVSTMEKLPPKPINTLIEIFLNCYERLLPEQSNPHCPASKKIHQNKIAQNIAFILNIATNIKDGIKPALVNRLMAILADLSNQEILGDKPYQNISLSLNGSFYCGEKVDVQNIEPLLEKMAVMSMHNQLGEIPSRELGLSLKIAILKCHEINPSTLEILINEMKNHLSRDPVNDRTSIYINTLLRLLFQLKKYDDILNISIHQNLDRDSLLIIKKWQEKTNAVLSNQTDKLDDGLDLIQQAIFDDQYPIAFRKIFAEQGIKEDALAKIEDQVEPEPIPNQEAVSSSKEAELESPADSDPISEPEKVIVSKSDEEEIEIVSIDEGKRKLRVGKSILNFFKRLLNY